VPNLERRHSLLGVVMAGSQPRLTLRREHPTFQSRHRSGWSDL